MICKICGAEETDNPDDICDDCMKKLIIGNMKPDVWSLGNSILYDLCKRYPKHETEEQIIAKIWLIGRSYAASIERRKQKDDKKNEDFYVNDVALKILNSNIDQWIKECLTKNSIQVYLETHKRVTDLYYDISGLEKRSLASKYLHFHLPEKFFIYDSRVLSSIGKLLKHFNENKFKISINVENYDEEYAKFYEKCFFITNKIREKYHEDLNCRQLDNLLISIGNSIAKKEI
jgi:serine/threonine protein kinase